jgi:hypothetical protein
MSRIFDASCTPTVGVAQGAAPYQHRPISCAISVMSGPIICAVIVLVVETQMRGGSRRTGQLSQVQPEPQLQVPDELQPQLPMIIRMIFRTGEALESVWRS